MFQDSEVVKSRGERRPEERPLIPCSAGTGALVGALPVR